MVEANGNFIKAMNSKDHTASTLAKAAGVNRITVLKAVQGKCIMEKPAQKMCDALGEPMDALFMAPVSVEKRYWSGQSRTYWINYILHYDNREPFHIPCGSPCLHFDDAMKCISKIEKHHDGHMVIAWIDTYNDNNGVETCWMKNYATPFGLNKTGQQM